MSGFQTEHAYFDFAHAVRGAYRHLIDQEASEFIAEVRRSSQRRWMKLPIGFLMWRAQLGIRGCSWGFDEDGPYLENSPHPPQRMKPLLHGAREGRANPKGVPVLYLASARILRWPRSGPGLGRTSPLASSQRLDRLSWWTVPMRTVIGGLQRN